MKYYLLLLFVIIGCGNMENQHGVYDPETGRDVTGDFASEADKELKQNLDALFAEAEKRKQEENIYDELSAKLEDIVNRHYRSMMQPVDEEFLQVQKEKLKEILR